MNKKLMALLLALTFALSGCAAMVETEYSSSSPHFAAADIPDSEPIVPTVDVADYAQLEAAILDLVSRGHAYGRISFSAYRGNPNEDIASACVRITNFIPLGAYSVYYIRYSLNYIVSYYEAEVSIIYRRRGFLVEELGDLTESVRSAVENRVSTAVYELPGDALTQEELDAAMDSVYYSDPDILYRPEISAEVYALEGWPSLAEVTLTYVYSQQETAQRLARTRGEAELILSLTEGAGRDEALRTAALTLAETAVFNRDLENTQSYSRWYHSSTAFGALVLKTAIGEGFAMAMKLMCRELGVSCLVVRGSLNGVSHTWNIVELENGALFHLDASLLDPESEGDIFRTDDEMADLYTWDREAYPACTGRPPEINDETKEETP